MTHTTMKLNLQQENTANIESTSLDALENVVITTVEAMPKVVTTSSNTSDDDNPTTKNISNVQLLYRVGEALQA